MTPTTPAPITSGEALTTAYAVMADFDYSGNYLIAVFEDRAEAEAWRADCANYERTRPALPEDDATDEAHERWYKADQVWQDEHPAGRDGVSANSFTVVEKPLHRRTAISQRSGAADKPVAQADDCPACDLPPDAFRACGSPNCAVRGYGPGDFCKRGKAVAEVASKYGDPEEFGERELLIDADLLQKLSYGTKLYAAPVAATADAAPAGAVAVLREMVEMMDSGDEHGEGSDWHVRAKAALAAAEVTPAPAASTECNGCDPAEGFCRVCRAKSAAPATAAGSVPGARVGVQK